MDGYSVGRWEGDVFVVESSGFNDDVWLDNVGRPATGALRVTERFVGATLGHMDIDITIDDPKAYTKPWNVTQRLALQPDAELIEYICNENNRELRDFAQGREVTDADHWPRIDAVTMPTFATPAPLAASITDTISP